MSRHKRKISNIRCDQCSGIIKVGEVYETGRIYDQDGVLAWRVCMTCVSWSEALEEHDPALAERDDLSLEQKLEVVRRRQKEASCTSHP